MFKRLSSLSLAFVIIPLVLAGVFLAGTRASGSAMHLWLANSGLNPEPAVTDSVTRTVYLPLVENHEWVAAPLRNGGFEADWDEEKSIACLIFHTNGYIESTLRDNIRNPPGWLTWFRQGLESGNTYPWSQPEVRDATYRNPDRMHSGNRGVLLFTYWRMHDAGFLQQTNVITGQVVQLSGWAHAWSNDGAHSQKPHDPAWSEGGDVGYNHFFALEGDDGLDGSERNFTFWLGIDPTGGTNPYASTVVWGQGAHIYNAFQQVPAVVAVAQGQTVTLFLRSRTLWPFEHNDTYWDDISVQVLE